MSNSLTKINPSILVQGLCTEISSGCWPRKGFSLGARGLESSYLIPVWSRKTETLCTTTTNKKKEKSIYLFNEWRGIYDIRQSLITILAASCQDRQLSTGRDRFSDSYVSCQPTSRSGPSHTEGPGTASNCSGSGGDGTGLDHSPNADWLASKLHWGIIKWPNPLLRVVFSIRVEADGHIFIQPQRKYAREKVLP